MFSLPSRWRLGCIALSLLLVPATSVRADPDTSLQALGRSFTWLENHAPDASSAHLGDLCLDAWAWYLFATLHPEAEVRKRAGDQVDRRLRALPPLTEQTVVSLSYWATLLRLMERRGIDATRYRTALSTPDVAAVLGTALPTTRWWTAELFRRSGLQASPDFSTTFISTQAAADGTDYTPTSRDAYRLFHELVPATDLGHEPLTGLTPEQIRFARRVMPRLLTLSRSEGDTDAVAETLVSAALLGERDNSAYRNGVAWLLAQRRPDGTYASARDRPPAAAPDNFRHVVLVGSWAVFTSLKTASP